VRVLKLTLKGFFTGYLVTGTWWSCLWQFVNDRIFEKTDMPSGFTRTASIVIREKEETSGAELLYSNALVNPYRNYLNEPYIIRSYPLIEKVVEELNLKLPFFRRVILNHRSLWVAGEG